MKCYVSTILFSANLSHVLLIRQDRAAAGRPELVGWNPPGGHVEPGESPHDAAVRELYEETGLALRYPPLGWLMLPVIERIDHPNEQDFVAVTYTTATDRVWDARTVEAEPVTVYPVQYLDRLKTVEWKWSARAAIHKALELQRSRRRGN